MRIAGLAVAAALLAGGAAQANAAPRTAFSLGWQVTEITAPQGPVELKKTMAVPFVRIAPANMIRIPSDAIDTRGRVLIKAGTVLAWNRLAARVACEPKIDEYLAFRCLEDSDGDGKFDNLVGITASDFGDFYGSRTEYLLGVFFLGRSLPLATPMTVPAAVPSDAIAPVDLEFAFTTQAGLIQKSGFALCAHIDRGKALMGGPLRDRFCKNDMLFSYGNYPATQPLAGGSVTVRGITGAVATIELAAPPAGYRLY